jgi:chemotaxis protein MotA
MLIPGLIVLFLCVFGGFVLSHGNLMNLLVYQEFIVIGGASLGGLIISTPKKVFKSVIENVKMAFKGSHIDKQFYLELMAVLFNLFSLSRKQGLLALEAHVSDPHTSDIYSKYSKVLHNHHALTFLNEALRLVIDGSVQPEELENLMDNSIDTHRAEAHMPVNIIQKTGDALPGLGIVGAVLGIIVTMQYMDGKPAEIGMHVSHALVGTFLGVFLAYGILNPMVTNLEALHQEEEKLLEVIKVALSSFVNGATPSTAVEYARRTVFNADRPNTEEVEKICKGGG